MKIALLALLLVLPAGLYAQERKKIARDLQNISVTVKSSVAEGSGTISIVTIDGERRMFVMTAGHVIDDLRKTREIIDAKTGTKRTLVEFDDAAIVSEFIQKGRAVGESKLIAEIIHYSDSDDGDDIGIFLIRKKVAEGQTSTKFYLGDEIPYPGMPLLHVGSLLGQKQGANSFTDGVMSQNGRLIGKKVFDQTTVSAFPGSSGGGVFNEEGEYVGMLVRGHSDTFNLITPIRRIREWAKAVKMEWLIDPSIEPPTMKELEKIQIEGVGIDFDEETKKKKFSRENFKSRYEYEENGKRYNNFLIKLTGPEAGKK